MEINGTLSETQIDVLSYVYISLLIPSVTGSFSVLMVSIVRWRNLQEQVHLLVQLVLADLLAALILMSTSIMNLVNNVYNVIICQYGLPLSLTFYFISFLLVVVYAWKSKKVIQGWRARPAEDEVIQTRCRRQILALPTYALYAVVWLIPIAIYLVYVRTPFISAGLLDKASNGALGMMGDTDLKYCTSCILFLHFWKDPCPKAEQKHDDFIRFFLVLLVIPVLLSCSVIYYNVGKWYERQEQEVLFPVEGDGQSRRRFKRVFSTARNMVLVILICWTPALILILLSSLKNTQQRSLFVLYVIQAATVSLQGFLNSMVYAWKRPNFTEAVLGENTPLVAYDRQAFFEESLRGTV
ncbi:uncharacterized protein LOC115421038 [Sphaeramia orbicularis]|uniref:Uncharacterized LOC115421038 n=1 Tax=Sphaeramia orbicularis TaxID=375764 RepID=A0A673AGS1_9TELE|nr:uncharacterized protein LOC115421038 [Sphaeramia orbicularis]